MIRSLLAAALAAMVLPLVAVPAYARPPHAPATVRTRQGLLRGRDVAGVQVRFFGHVPYAAPPVGALRWRPPRPPAVWHGVRDARLPGPACPQTENSNGPRSETEDCLYLDV